MTTMTLSIGTRTWPLAEDVADRILGAAQLWEEPSDTLRRLLNEAEPSLSSPADSHSPAPANVKTRRGKPVSSGRQKRPRAKTGTILPEGQYDLPILSALAEAEGRAAKQEVIDAVGRKLADQLLPADREMLGNEERWKKRAQFRRLKLIDQGLIERGSPRGVWEISDQGRAHLAQLERGKQAA
jgi:hypothetical protein